MVRRQLLAALLTLLCGCTQVAYPPGSDTRKSPTGPTSPSPSTDEVKIEFRVNGNATNVRIRFSNAQDGLTQIITTMPWVTTLTTRDDSMFVSLEATPISYSALTVFPFLSVQIFADGKLFRESTSNEFLLNTLAVSGTWRRP
jgi:hypothetical protein